MAPLTPVQKAAVIILRISGDTDKPVTLFEVAAPLRHRLATRARYLSKSNPEIQDDVLITYFKSPNSYTGENLLEISFHGNPLIVNSAMREFSDLGIRMAEPGEFTRRAYQNNKLTLSQAEAVEHLVSSATSSGVSRAYNTLAGDLDDIFSRVREDLLIILSNVEAEIDFAEDIEGVEHNIFLHIEKVKKQLNDLIDNYYNAQLSFSGVKVVIAGAPNVGKSTLFNTLIGADRAIVSSEAGTTRDLLTEQLVFKGVKFYLTDTAGVRQTDSIAEREGVLRAQKTAKDADLLVIVIDQSVSDDGKTVRIMNEYKNIEKIIVSTKSDLPSERDGTYADVLVSAKTGEGVQDLKDMLTFKISELTARMNDNPAPVSERQLVECIAAAKEVASAAPNQTLDITAYHLRKALEALDRTQGRQVGEETLDRIFSHFCIGK